MVKDGFEMKTVMSWSIGVASIAFLGLIMLILFGNLSGNVGFGQDSVALSTINETLAFANVTGYTLLSVNSSNSGYAITEAFNVEDGVYNVTIPLVNLTVSSLGVLTNATSTDYTNISVSYDFTHNFDSIGLANTNNFINNYTQSVLNTGEQFPTVGTIIGVALLLFILISLLIFALVKLAKIGGGSGKRGNFG